MRIQAYSLTLYKVSVREFTVVIFISLTRKLEQLSQGHTARKSQGWDEHRGLCDSRSVLVTYRPRCPLSMAVVTGP